MDGGAWWAAVHGVAKSQAWLSDFTFTFHFHALEKEMATHSSVLARIPGTEEPGGLPSTGSYRVGHDWSDLAAAAKSTLLTYLLLLGSHTPGYSPPVLVIPGLGTRQLGTVLMSACLLALPHHFFLAETTVKPLRIPPHISAFRLLVLLFLSDPAWCGVFSPDNRECSKTFK